MTRDNKSEKYASVSAAAPEVIRRLDRETAWFASGLVCFTILILTVLAFDAPNQKLPDLKQTRVSDKVEPSTDAKSVYASADEDTASTPLAEPNPSQAWVPAAESDQIKAQADSTSLSARRREIAGSTAERSHSLRRRRSAREAVVDAKARLFFLWRHTLHRLRLPRGLALFWHSAGR
jgi:hypothetical protein